MAWTFLWMTDVMSTQTSGTMPGVKKLFEQGLHDDLTCDRVIVVGRVNRRRTPIPW